MASVSLRHISKIFGGGVVALADVTLDISEREFFVVTGPAGCGKSVLLRIVCGLQDATGGELFMDGKPLGGVSVKDRDMVLVCGDMPLKDKKGSVYDHLAYGLKLRKTDPEQIKSRVSRAAHVFGIEDILGEKVSVLGECEKRICAIARVAARRPKVALLDDPLLGLAGEDKIRVMKALTALWENFECTIVCATPDAADAMTLGTRVAVMKKGSVCALGEPQTVYDEPEDTFTAAFFGDPPMCLIPSKIEKDGDKLTAKIGAEKILLAKSRTRRIINLPKSGEVVLGIRPEDFHTEQLFIEASPDTVINSKVRFIERHGGESVLYMGDERRTEITARADSRLKVERGDTVKLAVDSNKIHFFDAKSGRNLSVMPKYNLIDCRLLASEGGKLCAYFGRTKIVLPDETTARLLDRNVINGSAVLAIAPEALSFEKKADATAAEAEAEFTVGHGDFTAVYVRIVGCENFAVVKADPECNVGAGDKTAVYIDPRSVDLLRENGCKLLASRPVTDNTTSAIAEHRSGVTTLKFGKNKLVFSDGGKFKSGLYPYFRIPPVALSAGGGKPELTVLVQDYCRTGEYTVIYCALDGFEPYFTAALKGDVDCRVGSKMKLGVDVSALQPVGTKSLFDFISEKAKKASGYVFVEEENK